MPAPRFLRTLAVIVAVLGLALAGRLAWLPGHGGGLFGGPFNLMADNGQTVRDSDFRGRWMLIYFGYTSCPDLCPTSLAVMARAVAALPPALQAKVVPLFITLDPERDTPAVVGDYAHAFSPLLIGLSGSPQAVAAVAQAYRVAYRKVPDKTGGYTLDHSSVTYLMNPDGKFAAFYEHDVGLDALTTDLEHRLASPP